MKNIVLIIVTIPLVAIALFSFTHDTEKVDKVKSTINAFATGADEQNEDVIDKVLHPHFRLTMNRLFGSDNVSLMDKATYLMMIREKKFGGEKRKVSYGHIDIYGNNATAKVTFEGKSMTFITYLQLVKDSNSDWTIIGDLPTVVSE